MAKVKLIVIEEHTLGYTADDIFAWIFRASIIKGSTFNQWDSILLKNKTFRLATKKDFDDYNISFADAYENEDLFTYKKD